MAAAMPSAVRPWIVTFSALGINLMAGIIYAWSVLGRALIKQWHWSKMEAAQPFAVATATFAVMMIFAGRLQDRVGPRKVALMGGLMLGLGYILSASVHTANTMMLTMGVVGLGLGLAYSATTPAAIKWFAPTRKGLITGIVVSGVGLAAVYASPLAQWLIGLVGIPQTFLILGIGCIVVISLSAILVVNPPSGWAAGRAAPTAAPAAGATRASLNPAALKAGLDWHEMLQTRQFYFLWLMFVLSASTGLMLISNIAQIAKVQANWEYGFWAAMMLALFNTAGRFVSGFTSDRIGRTPTMILFFLIQAANMFLFVHYTSPTLILVGAAAAGLCYGTIFTLFPAATADFYGVKNLGVNYGLVFTAFGVAGVLGSLLGGRIADWFGSYAKAYIVLAILLLVACALALATRAPRETRV
jgi:OFA family oxalate/formate antiporter-like MFS transporter